MIFTAETETEEWKMKGYPIADGYMGYVYDRYMLFADESEYEEYISEDVWSEAYQGDDYRQYKPESKKVVASCASIAVTIKSVLDTPLLTEEGKLTVESETIVGSAGSILESRWLIKLNVQSISGVMIDE